MSGYQFWLAAMAGANAACLALGTGDAFLRVVLVGAFAYYVTRLDREVRTEAP